MENVWKTGGKRHLLEQNQVRNGFQRHERRLPRGVRVTHVPTGIAMKCTEQRTQLLNRNKALAKLKAKLLMIQAQL